MLKLLAFMNYENYKFKFLSLLKNYIILIPSILLIKFNNFIFFSNNLFFFFFQETNLVDSHSKKLHLHSLFEIFSQSLSVHAWTNASTARIGFQPKNWQTWHEWCFNSRTTLFRINVSMPRLCCKYWCAYLRQFTILTGVSPACYSIWVINLILLQTIFNICIRVHSLQIVPLTYRLFNHDQI